MLKMELRVPNVYEEKTNLIFSEAALNNMSFIPVMVLTE